MTKHLPLTVLFFVFGCEDRTDQPNTAEITEPTEPDEPTDAIVPPVFMVDFETTTGPVSLEIHTDWAPLGAARFHELVTAEYYDDARYFRVVEDFIVQFGLAADPAATAEWDSPISDDPVLESNLARTITFATAGPNTRTTQLFINLEDNATFDGQGFAPFGMVVQGMENIASINSEYGDLPDQAQIVSEGNAYLDAAFPNLDSIITARIRDTAR